MVNIIRAAVAFCDSGAASRLAYLLTVTCAFTWRAPRRHVTRHVISAYLLHSVVESLPVGVAEEPSCSRLDVVDDLINGHERKTHAVCQLTSKLLAIGAIKAHPPHNRLHACNVHSLLLTTLLLRSSSIKQQTYYP